MYADYKFAFRVEKEVGLAVNENGEKTEAFITVDFNKCKKEITEEKYQAMHKSFVNDLAKQMKCDPKYIVPISGQEYEENTEEEGK